MTDTVKPPIYLNQDYSPEERANDLIARMTIAEKVGELMDEAPGVERLGIPPYNWWNEALHGVARAGLATVFPQSIGMAATWNEGLVLQIASAISDEGRAKYHQALREGNHARYYGLTFWSPNVNIFRDPRWGRGQETYGEDPYLTSRLGVQFVRGLQGDDAHYLKTAACAKHFAVHSGPEADRHHFDARVSTRDMLMTYLPAFDALVREAQVAGVMGAYNRTNGEACCASPTLLQGVLRQDWDFDGYIVSDCGAIQDIYAHHHLAETPEEATAMAVKAGCNLNCGCTYEYLLGAVGQGLLTERDIDNTLAYLLKIKIRLGMFDPEDRVPYTQIPIEAVDSPFNQALALETARQSIVLLKNAGGLLPLHKNLKQIAVIGPNADDSLVLLGNYYGTPSESVTVLEGIRSLVSSATRVNYVRGCDILGGEQPGFEAALEIAESADVAVMVMGLSQQVEGEEGQGEGCRGDVTSQGDRETIDLPGQQEALLKAVAETGTPVVLVLLNGSSLAVNWAEVHIPAIMEAWYPGQVGGRAVAEVLFGDSNPGGRLPVTFYKSVADLPPFEDYAMAGRTYRYFKDEVLYPFGYGLSYTSFMYDHLVLSHDHMAGGETLQVSCEVRNVGDRTGDEVVQIYLRDEEASWPVPRHSLVGFKRIRLAAQAKTQVHFSIYPRQFACVDENGHWIIEPGVFTVFAGGGQPGTEGSLFASVEVVGEPLIINEGFSASG
ncbi:MAG: glycoside hydrolase family 3 C-terminal domain-containing protein [Chloroflexota bacterium]|nr:glycoside hydrolase family 3 C-terminal domain-containing protein [Chloroflexota bacterium]